MTIRYDRPNYKIADADVDNMVWQLPRQIENNYTVSDNYKRIWFANQFIQRTREAVYCETYLVEILL